jgi:hypothetical protein
MKTTLAQSKTYQATIALSPIESWVPNSMLEQKLKAVGFVGVTVNGTGAERKAKGIWSLPDKEVELPTQIKQIEVV